MKFGLGGRNARTTLHLLDDVQPASELSSDHENQFLDTLPLDKAQINEGLRDRLVRIYSHELRRRAKLSEVPHLHAATKDAITSLQSGVAARTRADVGDELRKLGHTEPHISSAIDVGLAMWLGVGRADQASYTPRWNTTETVQDYIDGRFSKAPVDLAETVTRIPRNFRAVDLETIASVKIAWTINLDEHLLFDDIDDNARRVRIFNDKSWLLASLSSQGHIGVPRELMEETLKSLDLLFPPWHTRTLEFLGNQGLNFQFDGTIPERLPRLREFGYWRERLIDLIVEFEAPPRNWRRIWRDRRNPAAFWTFWLGLLIFVMTLIFGIAASILAGFALRP